MKQDNEDTISRWKTRGRSTGMVGAVRVGEMAIVMMPIMTMSIVTMSIVTMSIATMRARPERAGAVLLRGMLLPATFLPAILSRAMRYSSPVVLAAAMLAARDATATGGEAGQFQGLFLDNVEAELTREIVPGE